MLDDKKFLAVIPARGGSKRLPRKNILSFSGKPLIAWTIEAALKSEYIDRVLVTSDDDEILDVAKFHGADTIKRPAHLSHDTSTSFDAIKHAILNTELTDFTVLLQPTSPLRTSRHIDEAILLLQEKNAVAVVSVTEMEHNPLWSNCLPEDGSMKGFLRKDVLNKRSQDLDVYYRLNGAIYIAHTRALLKTGSFFFQNNSYAYKMSGACSVDIDTEYDFKWAEFLLEDVFDNGSH